MNPGPMAGAFKNGESVLRRLSFWLSGCWMGLVTAGAMAQSTPTLDAVRQRGALRCGVSQGLAGFSAPDASGQWQGLDVDFCRAVASAIFGIEGSSKQAGRVQYVPLSAKERFTALQSGEIDVLSRNTTYSLGRDADLGVDFVGVIYYDGQGLIVKKDLKVTSAKELDGALVCINTGTTTELNISDYFKKHGLRYKPVVFEKTDEAVAAYDAGRCDAYSTDQSGLFAQRSKLRNKDDHLILPELVSKEPLGPAVRQGDPKWSDLLRWVLFALIEAEELGLTQSRIDGILRSDSEAGGGKPGPVDPVLRRFLGLDGNSGKELGVGATWAADAVRRVGHYGEVFERNLGAKTELKIDRGYNRLWKDGGLMYSMPFR